MVALSLIPFLYPDRLLRSRRRSVTGRYATVARGPHIPRECWLNISVRAKLEELRAVARELPVSQEAVCTVVQAMVAGESDF
jgi:hypothetical protein